MKHEKSASQKMPTPKPNSKMGVPQSAAASRHKLDQNYK